jgi:hypothetical protein
VEIFAGLDARDQALRYAKRKYERFEEEPYPPDRPDISKTVTQNESD